MHTHMHAHPHFKVRAWSRTEGIREAEGRISERSKSDGGKERKKERETGCETQREKGKGEGACIRGRLVCM